MDTKARQKRLLEMVHDTIWKGRPEKRGRDGILIDRGDPGLAGYAATLAPPEHQDREYNRLVDGPARDRIEASGLAPFNEMMREAKKARQRAGERERKQKARDGRREGPSLDEPITTQDGDEISRHEIGPGVEGGFDEVLLAESLGGLPLTTREQETVKLLWWGFSQKEIAKALGVTPGRVSQYKASARAKFEGHLLKP